MDGLGRRVIPSSLARGRRGDDSYNDFAHDEGGKEGVWAYGGVMMEVLKQLWGISVEGEGAGSRGESQSGGWERMLVEDREGGRGGCVCAMALSGL